MPKIIFIENMSTVQSSKFAQNLARKMECSGKKVKLYHNDDKDNPINFYKSAYFTKFSYRRIILNFTVYSGEIIENTILLDDVNIVRYENKGKELFVNPMLGVLKEHDFNLNGKNMLSLDDYLRVYQSAFEKFLQSDFTDTDFVVFDDSFVRSRINDLLEIYKLSNEKATECLNLFLSKSKNLESLVLYNSSCTQEDLNIFKNLNMECKMQDEFLL